MKNIFIASLLVISTALVAGPALASGYGPAPYYNPLAGAPASQRGLSAVTIAAETNTLEVSYSAYGGAPESKAVSSVGHQADKTGSMLPAQ
ncbi:hypothetical protein [uncultured Caballeronia sp.]|uniref:hypothetical protein n=1 Tax=uncultured Caballeronia sp. TaxID=1827198 RepID=UPI0035C96C00